MSRGGVRFMNAAATATSITPAATVATRGHLGLVVLGSMATGLGIGGLLALGLFAGGSEPQIIGSALLGLGTGFALLAYTSARRTNQPQQWALLPGAATALVGVSLLMLTPGERFLDLASWVWPVLVAMLVVSSF